jgi:hypothetical protein
MSALLGVAALDAYQWFREMLDNPEAPDVAATGPLKTVKEAKEFCDEPSLEEAADVIISVLGATFHRGWTVADVARAMITKTEVNRARTWHKLPDGTYQHD